MREAGIGGSVEAFTRPSGVATQTTAGWESIAGLASEAQGSAAFPSSRHAHRAKHASAETQPSAEWLLT